MGDSARDKTPAGAPSRPRLPARTFTCETACSNRHVRWNPHLSRGVQVGHRVVLGPCGLRGRVVGLLVWQGSVDQHHHCHRETVMQSHAGKLPRRRELVI